MLQIKQVRYTKPINKKVKILFNIDPAIFWTINPSLGALLLHGCLLFERPAEDSLQKLLTKKIISLNSANILLGF